MGLYKMIKADEIAVCVSGLARSGYEEAIAIAKRDSFISLTNLL